MRSVIANRRRIGSAPVSVIAVSLALVVSVLWLFGSAGQVHACKCAEPGPPSEELGKFAAVFAGRVVSVQHSYDPDGESDSAPRASAS